MNDWDIRDIHKLRQLKQQIENNPSQLLDLLGKNLEHLENVEAEANQRFIDKAQCTIYLKKKQNPLRY